MNYAPMNIIMFYHSMISDWSHGNAHFLRGISTELLYRGHNVQVYEPRNSLSLSMLNKQSDKEYFSQFCKTYPKLESLQYDPDTIDLDKVLDQADLVIVHQWDQPQLVNKISKHRIKNNHYKLLFHDTNHRIISAPQEIERFQFDGFDGLLAFGDVIRQIYLHKGLFTKAWTWHRAADIRVFKPIEQQQKKNDIVWVGNCEDEEKARELKKFLFKPIRSLQLNGDIYGISYPEKALKIIKKTRLTYKGWISNFTVPNAFAKAKLTIHLPRKYYTLSGIPTIRPFEAMACGIPLICSPWQDSENLFRLDVDYMVARNPKKMKEYIQMILHDQELADSFSNNARNTILRKHTCSHRADELMEICKQLGLNTEIKIPEKIRGNEECLKK